MFTHPSYYTFIYEFEIGKYDIDYSLPNNCTTVSRPALIYFPFSDYIRSITIFLCLTYKKRRISIHSNILPGVFTIEEKVRIKTDIKHLTKPQLTL